MLSCFNEVAMYCNVISIWFNFISNTWVQISKKGKIIEVQYKDKQLPKFMAIHKSTVIKTHTGSSNLQKHTYCTFVKFHITAIKQTNSILSV